MKRLKIFCSVQLLVLMSLLCNSHSVHSHSTQSQLDDESISNYKSSFEANGGKVLTPLDEEYEMYTTPWNLLCTDRPYVVFLPATYHDIQDIFVRLRDDNLEFNVMAGGHNWDCEATTSAALINMSLFNRLDIDFGNQTITLGAGVLWDEIYHELKDSGFMAIGPLCPTVGVSGYTLGGGFNWFLNTFYGTAAENTISIDVLLSSGDIVTATRHNEYADLAWALLGSGRGQFGIVLEFHMKIYIDPGFSHTFIPYTITNDESEVDPLNGIYHVTDYMKIYKAWVNAVKMIKDDESIGSIAMNTNRDFSNGTDGPRHYLFFVAGVFNQVKNWTDMESMMDVMDTYPPNAFYQTYFNQWYDMDYTLFAPPWMKYPITTWAGQLAYLTDFNELTIEAHGNSMVPLNSEDADTYSTGTHLESFFIKGGVKNSTLTSVGNANFQWKLARFYLELPESAMDGIFDEEKDWNKKIEKVAGDDYLGGYINYGDPTLNKKYYYGENLKMLKQIKEKYDRDNVFDAKQGIVSSKKKKMKKHKTKGGNSKKPNKGKHSRH